jgi:hypothetical protein
MACCKSPLCLPVPLDNGPVRSNEKSGRDEARRSRKESSHVLSCVVVMEGGTDQ